MVAVESAISGPRVANCRPEVVVIVQIITRRPPGSLGAPGLKGQLKSAKDPLHKLVHRQTLLVGCLFESLRQFQLA